MPLGSADFTNFIDGRLAAADAASPLQTLDPRMRLFASYNGVYNSTSLSLLPSSSCWLDPAFFSRVALHSAWINHVAQRCVAITPRHVIMNEHGNTALGAPIVWMSRAGFDYEYGGSPSQTVVRNTVGAVYNINKSGIAGTPDTSATQAFRIYYTDGDAPVQLVCPMLLPQDIGTTSLKDVPVVQINQLEEAVCHTLFRDPLKEWLSCYLESELISNGSLAYRRRSRVFRQPYGGDSGSPVLYIINGNEYLAGHLGSAQGGANPVRASGASVLSCYKHILEACERLNDAHAASYNAPRYTPVTRYR